MVKATLRNPTKELRDSYEYWLFVLVESKRTDQAHSIFLDWLHHHYFEPKLRLDENREGDGRSLRDRFESESNFIDYSPLHTVRCSWLELLIGLADRINYIMSDHPKSSISHWFWIMVDNVGFQILPTDHPDFKISEKTNEMLLDRLTNRMYGSDGTGGLFPLKKAKINQRNVEMWYQMQAWIQEQE